MDKETLQQRLYDLMVCLQFCSQEQGTFTTGERIMINQERGQLFRNLDGSDTTSKNVSIEIENKIEKILTIISKYQWQAKEI